MIHNGDCLEILPTLPAESVQTCITSPPYFGLRDYGCEGQIGLEPTPDEFVAALVAVFREVRRVLRDDGTLWLNLGDSYAGARSGPDTGSTLEGTRHNQNAAKDAKRAMIASHRRDDAPVPRSDLAVPGLPAKNLIGIPWRVAFALQADGWYLRQDIIWAKPNPMPESVRDRCTKSHEYMFLLSKSPRYYFDAEAIAEPANLTGKGFANGFRGGSYVGGESFDNTQGSKRKRSGNIERKPGTARGCPAGTGSNVCGSVPWEGDTRNKRSVWTVATKPFKEAHFATYPPELIEPCVLAGSRLGDLVLDPFMGAGTTAVVAQRLARRWVGCELNPEYARIAEARIRSVQPGLPL